LGRVVVLGREHTGGEVPVPVLWEAAKMAYDAYIAAVEELVGLGLAETHTSDFATLKPTPEEMALFREA
jgi:hypothetical protein